MPTSVRRDQTLECFNEDQDQVFFSAQARLANIGQNDHELPYVYMNDTGTIPLDYSTVSSRQIGYLISRPCARSPKSLAAKKG